VELVLDDEVGRAQAAGGAQAASGAVTGARGARPVLKQYREKDGLFYFKLQVGDAEPLLQSLGFADPKACGACIGSLKADPQTRWINEGLPKSYTGKPMGSNLGHNDIPELLPNEVLPGSIDYSSPNARLRWGDYMIRGDYHALNGTDGDAVSRNYRFVQDPANATALHIGPYIPDYEYYKAITQTSKMIPDEYAYENASLDRQSHFGRKADAEVTYDPPSINTVKDGTEIMQTGIRIADETVFSLVNEVFGAR